MLSSCGHERCSSSDYDWHGLKRGTAEFALIQVTLAGEGCLRVGDRHWRLQAGQAMLLHFPADNRYWLPPDSPAWQFYYVCVHGREVMRHWIHLCESVGPVVEMPEDSPVLAQIGELVALGTAGEVRTPYQASSLAYGLTMSLLHTYLPRAGTQRSAAITRACRYARANAGELVGVAEMARAAGLSRAHFSRIFAASEGMAPGEYLRQMRVELAVQLLSETDLTVAEIARHSGFGESAYFARAFRRAVGLSPREFRRSGMYS